jgi:hypothetical protein
MTNALQTALVCALVLVPVTVCAGESRRLDGTTPAERGMALTRFVASVRPEPKDENVPKQSAPCYAARLVLGEDVTYALEKLDASVSYQLAKGRDRIAKQAAYDAAPDKTGLKRPGAALDPFDKAALMNTYFLGKDKIPAHTAKKIRDYVCLYHDHKALEGYARGAWNYKLMLDASGFLAAEEWPDLVDRAGLNATQIQAATRKRLVADLDTIARLNHGEYGAPIYLAVNLSAIRMLAEFARDEDLRNRAALTLDAMLLDIACTWNQGLNVGSASRAKYWHSTDTGPDSMASTAAAAWVFFGAHRPIAEAGIGYAHSFWMAAPGRYQLPEPIIRVAQERGKPFLHHAYVARMDGANVHRFTWHTPSYSLCSQWDQPGTPTSGLYKESRRMMLKWLSDKPSSTFAVCMENPHRPYNLAEKKANQLGYGENGFAQYMQHEGTMLGLYAVPEEVTERNRTFPYPYHRLYAPFPTTGSIRERMEKDGWVFCHNGSMLMAFHCIKPWTWGKKWGNHDMLWCDARRNGWILETSPLDPFAGGGTTKELERFAKAVLTKTIIDADAIDADQPVLRYRNLAGRTLEFRWQPHAAPYAAHQTIDGKAREFSDEWLLFNPWVKQKTGGPLVIEIGGERLSYDFATWTRTHPMQASFENGFPDERNTAPANEIVVHVSPRGDDHNSGDVDNPFATPHREIEDLPASAKRSPKAHVRIVLDGGRYEIEQPLVIGRHHVPPQGSLSIVSAEGKTAVISGGRRIDGWSLAADGSWTVTLPDVASGRWTFRELFVGGQRRPRVRHPDEGYLRIHEAFPDKRSGFTFRPGELPNQWQAGGELVFLHDWSISRIPVRNVAHGARRVTVAFPIGDGADHYKIDHFERHPRYFVENHSLFLDAPGEWFLDERTGVLTYRPQPGETPEVTDVVAPRATALLIVAGEADDPVRHVNLRGLHLEHCGWQLPEGGYAEGQATVHERRDGSPQQHLRQFVPVAVQFELADDCSVTHARIAHLGTSGIAFGSRTQRCRLEDSTIEDVAGNGINLGEDTARAVNNRAWWQSAPDQVAVGHVIAHNRIEHCGQQFFGAVGVWVGIARDITLANNEITRLPYTGISLGWMWNPTPTPAGNNVVRDNHIHHVMQKLSDGGGIYTLGCQPGTRLVGNRIHDVPLNVGRAESNGMFLDEGSDQIAIEDNVIYNIDRSPLRFHKAQHMVVRGNTLVVPEADIPPLRYVNTNPGNVEQIDNHIAPAAEFDAGRIEPPPTGPRAERRPTR